MLHLLFLYVSTYENNNVIGSTTFIKRYVHYGYRKIQIVYTTCFSRVIINLYKYY